VALTKAGKWLPWKAICEVFGGLKEAATSWDPKSNDFERAKV
jgi:hypothetical protein